MPAGPHVAPGRAQRRRPLEDQLPAEEHERPGDVEAVREERAIARIRPLLGAHPAHREDHLVGLAREQVAAARAAVTSRPIPLAWSRSISSQSAGPEHAIVLPGLLLDPAERRDVLVRSEQDPGLARAGLRGEVGLPLDRPDASRRRASGHRRRVPVAHRPPQHGQRQPVDLEEEDPRNVGRGHASVPSRDPLDHP